MHDIFLVMHNHLTSFITFYTINKSKTSKNIYGVKIQCKHKILIKFRMV
jgi:hypothetical protein